MVALFCQQLRFTINIAIDSPINKSNHRQSGLFDLLQSANEMLNIIYFIDYD
jgi:hypothetical protein